MNWAMEHENDGDISQQPKIKHNHGMMTPTLIMGSSTSLTCLGMKPECLKSAPSPLSFLYTVVKSNLADDVVILTSEMHDPCAQESPTHEKKTRTPYRRHRCGAGQTPSEG